MILSQRAITTIKKILNLWRKNEIEERWGSPYYWALTDEEDLEKGIGRIIKQGKLKNAGQKTLNEIMEFHRLLREIWM